MFSKRMLEEGTAVALKQGEQLLAKLDAHAASGEPLDLQKAFFAFTMDTFAEIAFGAALDSQNTDHRFTQAFDTAQQLCNDRFGRPWFSLLKLLKTPSEAAIEREVGIMRGFALGIVQGRRRQKESGEPLGADLVSRFLASPSGGDMTDDELIDVVLNFIIAGRDTTACALSWASLRLLRAEDVRERMNAEVEAEIGKVVGLGKRPQLQELPAGEVFNLVHKSLPYTRAVVSEALRLHPSVPKDAKYAVAADTLPDGTTVPRGCCMIWSNYAFGRDPTLWNDPLRFDPERWLQPAEESEEGEGKKAAAAGLWRPTTFSDFVYPVFNAGPRLCLGRPLAYLEIQLMLAVVFGRYELAEARQHTEAYLNTLVAPMKEGLLVTPRRKGA
eukprot:COSAG04_NODE_4114_length_2290_cov_1.161114_2_plen_386_part_00